jgi:preprotein translocase SecF subunit
MIKRLWNNIFKDKQVVEHRRLWFAIPLVIMLIAFIVFCSFWIATGYASRGMNLGIDFTGGNIVTVELASGEASDNFGTHEAKIREIIQRYSGNPAISHIVDSGGAEGIAVRYTFSDTDPSFQETQNRAIQDALELEFVDIAASATRFVTHTHIGAAASRALISSAFISLGVAMVVILIYIAVRFRLWTGIAAILAQIHDAVIMFALVIIFRVQMNTGFVAALITIAAYSITNTVVIFDRVRENTKEAANQDEKVSTVDIVNRSIFQTATLKFNTTITTLFSILMLAIIGVSSVREFAIPVIFGLIVGFYSSLVLAPSIYVALVETADKYKKKKLGNEQNLAQAGRKAARKGGETS